MIYGIPRSTLRNKVYKLGKDRSRSYGGKSGNSTLEESPVDSVTLLKNDLGRHGVHLTQIGRDSSRSPKTKLDFPHTNPSAIPCSQSQGGFKSGLEGDESEEEVKSEDISHEKKVLKEWLRTKLSRQTLAQSKVSTDILSSPPGRRAPPSLGNITDCTEDENSDVEESKKEPRQDIILKIPSFLNNKSGSGRTGFRRKIKLRSHKDDSSAPKLRLAFGFFLKLFNHSSFGIL